jgi:predicted alpha/beta-fold hydrolase
MSIHPYKPPFFIKNGHILTIYPSLFRKIDTSFYKRERITTPDDDFLDLDWSCKTSNRLAIISHGLEGSSTRPYVAGMALALNNSGWDTLAWNYRSCSGEINHQLRFYHNGATDDLDLVIKHAINTERYNEIVLVGFSMGGNLTLVYLGQYNSKVDPIISKAIVFSVPCDLESSAYELTKPLNKLYMNRFIQMLHQKVRAKMLLFPDRIDDKDYNNIKSFKDFDDRYTAPIHGYKNAEDYWHRCSSKQFLTSIKIPVLIINAADDPFLAPECYPLSESSASTYIDLEIPQSGGHVGFVAFNANGQYWSEYRTLRFLSNGA